jgi:hypothetical protein
VTGSLRFLNAAGDCVRSAAVRRPVTGHGGEALQAPPDAKKPGGGPPGFFKVMPGVSYLIVVLIQTVALAPGARSEPRLAVTVPLSSLIVQPVPLEET